MRLPTLLTILTFLVLLADCQRERNEKSIPDVLATIDGDSITSEEFSEAFKDIDTGMDSEVKMGEGKVRELKKEILEQLIERKIFLQEANNIGIKVEDVEVRRVAEGVKADYPPGDFDKMLKEKGVSYADWEKRIREDIIIEKLHDRVLETQADVSEEETRRYYNEHIQEFSRKEEIRVRQVVVANEEESIRIRQALLSGADFGTLAKEKSLSPDRDKGGDLGFFSKGMMPKEFDVVFSLKIGEISSAIKTPYGYHIFKVEEKRQARRLAYKDVKSHVRDTLTQEKREELFRQWVEDLKKRFSIKINYELLYGEEKIG